MATNQRGVTPFGVAIQCRFFPMVLMIAKACCGLKTTFDRAASKMSCHFFLLHDMDHAKTRPFTFYLFFAGVQEKLGIMNNGVVYAVFGYEAHNQDELTFDDGDRIVVLRKGDDTEREWWWSRIDDREGYVPRNLLGVSLISVVFFFFSWFSFLARS